MTTPTLIEMAERLTKAQREFLLSLPQYAVDSYPPARWLVHRGLAEKAAGEHRYRATPLGIEVAACLRARASQGGE